MFPDRIAPHAIAKLTESASAYGMSPVTDGTAAATRAIMKEWGISRAVFCAVATNEHQTHSVNNFAVSFLGDDLFTPFASVLPCAESALDEVKRVHALGVKGIKIHPEYQNFEVADERAFPFYEYCERAGLIVIVHAGFDPAYPERRLAPPKSIRIVKDTFPRLKLVAAHGGGQQMWEESISELSKSGVYVDTSCVSRCEPSLYKKLLFAFPAERILFATDCPWSTAPNERAALAAQSLPRDVLERIYWENAKELLGL